MDVINAPSVVTASVPPKEERNMAMLCHLLALSGYVIPMGHVLGPLLIWLLKKDEMTFVDQQGREALNFQLSVTLYLLAASVLVCFGGFLLLIPLGLFQVVMTIIAGVRANEGARYRYPLTLRFL